MTAKEKANRTDVMKDINIEVIDVDDPIFDDCINIPDTYFYASRDCDQFDNYTDIEKTKPIKANNKIRQEIQKAFLTGVHSGCGAGNY